MYARLVVPIPPSTHLASFLNNPLYSSMRLVAIVEQPQGMQRKPALHAVFEREISLPEPDLPASTRGPNVSIPALIPPPTSPTIKEG